VLAKPGAVRPRDLQAIRARVGRDFHLQMKISATEFNNALLPQKARQHG